MLEERRAFASAAPPQVLEQIYRQTSESFFRALGLSDFEGKFVALTRALPDELSTKYFAIELAKRGARLCYPRLDGDDMVFHEVSDPETESWIRGTYGIEEPGADLPVVEPEEFHWVFVPGVLFSKIGQRIGMGKGYFDRFLSKCKDAIKVGVAYDFQVKTTLPQEIHDVSMDWIACPFGATKCIR